MSGRHLKQVQRQMREYLPVSMNQRPGKLFRRKRGIERVYGLETVLKPPAFAHTFLVALCSSRSMAIPGEFNEISAVAAIVRPSVRGRHGASP